MRKIEGVLCTQPSQNTNRLRGLPVHSCRAAASPLLDADTLTVKKRLSYKVAALE
jgi:hypothetical protein